MMLAGHFRLSLTTALVATMSLFATSLAFGEIIPGYPDDFTHAYDPRDLAVLPGYCKYTQVFRQNVPGGDNRAEIDRMYATLGPGFHALHHYCWAIIGTHRALFLARTKEVRTFYLDYAVKDIDFVINNSPRDFVLLPELLTEKAKNLIRLGRDPLAVGELLRAIELKADYWPPYAVLADYYVDQGQVAQARDILQKGLAAAPNAKALRARLDKLRLQSAQGQSKHAK